MIRAGYRHDLEGVEDDVASGGVGLRVGRFVADAAYTFGGNVRRVCLSRQTQSVSLFA